MSTVFMFSGQGSQYFHMGHDLFEQDIQFRNHVTSLDGLARVVLGYSVLEKIYPSDKNISDPLDDPILSGLSLFIIELALVKTLNNRGFYADTLLGSSFGTLIATIAAQWVDEESGLRIIAQLGKVFSEFAKRGSMLVVLTSLDFYFNSSLLRSKAELAGKNFDTSFVLSLPECHLEEVEAEIREAHIAYQKLPIATAFHSSWIEGAKDSLFDICRRYGSKTPTIPISCTSQTEMIQEISSDTIWNAVRGPMNFQDTVNRLELKGPHRYVDVGPSGTLATFVKYILPDESKSEGFQILSPYRQGSIKLENLLSSN